MRCIVLFLLMLTPVLAGAQGGWKPDRPVELVIGAAPGGANDRILRLAYDGSLLNQFGSSGRGNGQLSLGILGGLALDALGRLFVADAGNNRIQIFDQDGNYLDQWHQFSRPSGVYIDKNDIIYVADSESGSVNKAHGDWKRGMRVGRVSDGAVTAFIPDPNENATTTSAAEGVTADANGNIYGAEVGPKRVNKYVKNGP